MTNINKLRRVAILGNQKGFIANHICASLREKGAETFIVDPRTIALQTDKVPRSVDEQEDVFLCDKEDGFAVSRVGSIFLCSSELSDTGWDQEKIHPTHCLSNSLKLLKTLHHKPDINWVNCIQAHHLYQSPMGQLSLAQKLGAKFPKTIVSHDPREVLAFSQSVSYTAFMPLEDNAQMAILSDDLMDYRRLDFALCHSPVKVQEYIVGSNIRTYVLGDRVYSAQIQSDMIDCSEDLEARIVPVNTPEHIHQLSKTICRQFAMQWTAIDWRVDRQGHYYFLQANPGPIFQQFEQQTGYPVTEQLTELLVA